MAFGFALSEFRREVEHSFPELTLHLLLVDHIRQRESPDETAVRPLDPMILLHFD
jgi:hypothetical protein